MVSDDKVNFRLVYTTGDLHGMDKAFFAARCFGRPFIFGQFGDDSDSNFQGTDHFSLGEARMYRHALNTHTYGISRERLIFDRTGFLSVYRVAKPCTQFLQINMVHTPTDFLIGCKQDRKSVVEGKSAKP